MPDRSTPRLDRTPLTSKDASGTPAAHGSRAHRWDARKSQDRVIQVEDTGRVGELFAGLRGRAHSMWSSLDGSGRPQTGWAYSVLAACVIGLTALGLIMVLSASAVEAISQDLNPVSLFSKQAMWAVFGLLGMWAISRLPVSLIRRVSWLAYAIAVLLLIAVLVFGVEINGNKNWIRIGGFSLQPSEPAKLALAIWSANFLAKKRKHLGNWKETTLPVLLFGGLIIGLVLLGHDLGTSIILFAILLTALWAAGVRFRIIALILAAAALVGTLMSLQSSNRASRIQAWLGNCDTGQCDQAQAGMTALARGGWFGVGLGQSQVKWSWLPEAHNDFVFAIIGEELGWFGTVFILLLFAVLTLVALRVIVRYDDLFIRVCGSCIIVWIALQAIMNISMVVGLLPVIGLPLPFISYGGSALTFTLWAVGVLMAFARRENLKTPAERKNRT